METRERSELWGHETGSYLLALWLNTLNCVVHCVGPYAPAADLMVRDFFRLAWTFRDAEVPEVRMAVLHAVSTVFGCVQYDVQLLDTSALKALTEYVKEAEHSDPEEDCRTLASKLSNNMTGSIHSPMLMEVVSTHRR